MKMLLVSVLAVTALSSCGLQRQVNELKNRQAQSEVDSAARDAALQSQIDNLQASLANVQSQLIMLGSSADSSATQISALQAQQGNILVQLATLQGYTSIVSIFNPCGPQTAADEVFLQLSNGKYLASFSDSASGTNTRFSELYDGNFTSTDGSGCFFTVSGNGTVISNEHN